MAHSNLAQHLLHTRLLLHAQLRTAAYLTAPQAVHCGVVCVVGLRSIGRVAMSNCEAEIRPSCDQNRPSCDQNRASSLVLLMLVDKFT